MAEKLRLLIFKENFDTVGEVTCSFGVGACQEEDHSTESVKRADDALYEAKKSGKNKVCCSPYYDC